MERGHPQRPPGTSRGAEALPLHRIKVGQTIKKHVDGIQAAVQRSLASGRHEGLNNKVRLIIRRAYGFHNTEHALAMIMLVCGPVTLKLPYHT